jgi:hypothetical protein
MSTRKADHEILRAADNADTSWRLARLRNHGDFVTGVWFGALIALHWVMQTRTIHADRFDEYMDDCEAITPEQRDAIRTLIKD